MRQGYDCKTSCWGRGVGAFFHRSLLPLAWITVLVAPALAQKSVWTAQYNNDRTAANIYETTLTSSNVNTKQFGLLFSRQVDGFIFAQPLFMPAVTIQGVARNVVYVATMNNSVYAFDADHPADSAPLWHVNLGPVLMRPGSLYTWEIGILSTPVIDTSTNTMYVCALVTDLGVNVYVLHALDITTGRERARGPKVITGSVPGSAPDAVDGMVTFDPSNLLQRPALSLFNGIVSVAFGTLNDKLPYHGWLMSYDTKTLEQTGIWCTTPNGTKGGIWMSGRGIAQDSNGIYLMTGDGDTGPGGDLSDAFVRIFNQQFDYFLPANYQTLDSNDWDLNAAGPMLLPNTGLLLGGGKTGTLFVLNRTNLGGYMSGNTQVVQSWQATAGCTSSQYNSCNEIHHYAYWYDAPGAPRLYLCAKNETLKAFEFTGKRFNTTPVAQNVAVANSPGGQLALSANGGKPGTGILWAAMTNAAAPNGMAAGILRAFDAVSLRELWNSNLVSTDNAGLLAKYCLPTVTNGKVYLATLSNQLNVYGLR